MGNYIIFFWGGGGGGFENPGRGGQARNLTTNVPRILDLKSSSEQIFFKNCLWVPLYSYKTSASLKAIPSSVNMNDVSFSILNMVM